MIRNEIYQFGLTETAREKGKPVIIGNLSKRENQRETGKKNKTTQKCDTRQNSKFSVRKKTGNTFGSDWNQTFRSNRQEETVMCETRKIKVKQKEEKTIENQFIFETKKKNSLGKTIFGQSKYRYRSA